MLAEKMNNYRADAWLVNTGWSGGGYGVGKRLSLKYTRAIIDAIHSGELAKAPTVVFPIFGLSVPTICTNVPSEVLMPRNTWNDKAAFDATLLKLGKAFDENFKKYASKASQEIINAGPKIPK